MLSARCESAGGATFAPIAKAVRTFLRLDAEWRAQLAKAQRLFAESGATGHAARVAKGLGL